ncbi:GNAT family N-acetyltransferase [Erysipelothrix sp. HDW6C]|uniref:GNAT family N-acetyltransferase n=1 Tax=Erysipelothrix sp. HDW6C TaxID=2714930 RepID=UPI00140AD3BB|nr:GNAT family N-acetyltransferase [Erysipelothrix sp. HDW6C]QIK69354.1 GNAT family N-acetyltransferase [Erysipelothrix sp. HDW6C]
MTYTIKKIAFQDFSQLYKNRMKHDFPTNELRPLFAIKRMFRKGIYTCYVMREGGETLGYACLIFDKQTNVALLDYYAVTQTRRGEGLGSKFLSLLKPKLTVKGLIIEVEKPDCADTEAEATTRRKRIEFYFKSESVMTDWQWDAFGVSYNLLWMPVKSGPESIDFANLIRKFYEYSIPKFVLNHETAIHYLGSSDTIKKDKD